jgi:catechol 2,3-dioxygenase-like lactoylglutathione lyase family enzyme
MLANHTPTTTLATSDLARAKTFYESLGFTADNSEPGGWTFTSGDAKFFV